MVHAWAQPGDTLHPYIAEPGLHVYVHLGDGREHRLPLEEQPDLRGTFRVEYDSVTFKVRDDAGYEFPVKTRVLARDNGRLVFHGYVTRTKEDTGPGGRFLEVTAYSVNFLLWKRMTRNWRFTGVTDKAVLRALMELDYENLYQWEHPLSAHYPVVHQVVARSGFLELMHDTATTFLPEGHLESERIITSGEILGARVEGDVQGFRSRVFFDPFLTDEFLLEAMTALWDEPLAQVRLPDLIEDFDEPFTNQGNFVDADNVATRGGRLEIAGLLEASDEISGDNTPAGVFAAPGADTSTAIPRHLKYHSQFAADPETRNLYVIAGTSGEPLVLLDPENADILDTISVPVTRERMYPFYYGEQLYVLGAQHNGSNPVEYKLVGGALSASSDLPGLPSFAGGAGSDARRAGSIFQYRGELFLFRGGPSPSSFFLWRFNASTVAWDVVTFTDYFPPVPPNGNDSTWAITVGEAGSVLMHVMGDAGNEADSVRYLSEQFTWESYSVLRAGIIRHSIYCSPQSPGGRILYRTNSTIAPFQVWVTPAIDTTVNEGGEERLVSPGTPPPSELHFGHRYYDQRLGTMQFEVRPPSSGETTMDLFMGAWRLRLTSTGVMEYWDGATWEPFTTSYALGVFGQVRLQFDTLDADSSEWELRVFLRGFDEGFVAPLTPTTAGTVLLAQPRVVVSAPYALRNFILHGSNTGPVSTTSGRADVGASFTNLVQRAYIEVTGEDLPGDSSIAYSISLDGGTSFMAVEPTTDPADPQWVSIEVPVTASPIVRVELLASTDGSQFPSLDHLTLTVGSGFDSAGVYESTVITQDAVRGDFVTITSDHEVPADTTLTWQVSSNGGANFETVPHGVETQIPPAEVGTELIVRANMTSTDPEKTPRIRDLRLEWREAGDPDGAVRVLVSRDNGSTFHEVTTGESFDLTGFTGESPKNQFRLRVEIETSVASYTPSLGPLRVFLESAGLPWVQVWDAASAAHAHYSLQDGDGVTAGDSTGNGHSLLLGPVAGEPAWASPSGLVLGVDGQHGEATAPVTEYPFTLEAECSPDERTGDHGVISVCGPGGTVAYGVGFRDGEVLLYAHNGSTEGSITHPVTSVGRVHITAVFVSATERHLYINGRLVGTSAVDVSFNAAANRVRIGTQHGDDTGPYRGLVYRAGVHPELDRGMVRLLALGGTGAHAVVDEYAVEFRIEAKGNSIETLRRATGAEAYWTLDPSTGRYYLSYNVPRPSGGPPSARLRQPIEGVLGEGVLRVVHDSDGFEYADRAILSNGGQEEA